MQKPFITQSELFVSTNDLDHLAPHALDDTEGVLDWSKIEPILYSIYASQTGRPSYSLLTMFRGLLLGVWYRLSDVQLSQCLYRDLLFRKFCHLELGGDIPEASTLGRFRNQLVEHDLWEQLRCIEHDIPLVGVKTGHTEGSVDTYGDLVFICKLPSKLFMSFDCI